MLTTRADAGASFGLSYCIAYGRSELGRSDFSGSFSAWLETQADVRTFASWDGKRGQGEPRATRRSTTAHVSSRPARYDILCLITATRLGMCLPLHSFEPNVLKSSPMICRASENPDVQDRTLPITASIVAGMSLTFGADNRYMQHPVGHGLVSS